MLHYKCPLWRHSRESGNPEQFHLMDSCLHRNDMKYRLLILQVLPKIRFLIFLPKSTIPKNLKIVYITPVN
jgi:hypothetical protein